MSDELIKSLQSRVTELDRENLGLKTEAKDRRLKGKGLQAQVDELTAKLGALATERDGFKLKAEAGPAELTGRIAELEGTIRTGKHKAAFDKAAGVAGVAEGALDDLWTLSGYKAEGDEPDQAAVDAAIAGARTAKPYLFKGEAATATATTTAGTTPAARLKVAVNLSRGNAPPTGGFRVTAANTQDHVWMRQNAGLMAEAKKAGTLIFDS